MMGFSSVVCFSIRPTLPVMLHLSPANTRHGCQNGVQAAQGGREGLCRWSQLNTVSGMDAMDAMVRCVYVGMFAV